MHTIKILVSLLVLSVFSTGFVVNKGKEKPVDLVDPLIDTHKSRYDYFVSAAVPFGINWIPIF
ncbi:MAG: hypothetical protein AAGU19_12435 [Prolixibacteraceae bacterium]